MVSQGNTPRHQQLEDETSKFTSCDSSGNEGIVSVIALLRLAKWCQSREETTQGGGVSCKDASGQSPPALTEVEPTHQPLGADSGVQSKSSPRRSQQADREAADTSKAKGGVQ